jgi:uncharacterized membrane protein HdeD (DUF308 family)
MPTSSNHPIADAWRQHAGSLRLQGGLIVLLGIIAIVLPVISTLALTVVLGVVLLIAGVAEGTRAVRAWGQQGAGMALVLGVVAVIAGLLVLVDPLSGALSLAIVIGAYMILSGVAKARFAWALRPHAGWGWMAFSAALSIVLGVVILAGLPMTALWVPGTLLGIELVFFGMALFMLAGALRNIA